MCKRFPVEFVLVEFFINFFFYFNLILSCLNVPLLSLSWLDTDLDFVQTVCQVADHQGLYSRTSYDN